MHKTLASGIENADFAPEAFAQTHAADLYSEINQQAHSTLRLLQAKFAALPPQEQKLAARVLELEPQIQNRFKILPAITTTAERIRYHGDYHLGQVLYTGSDFMIIDFEGEPARPLQERRHKALALRDMAGMLRSFQYAAFGGLQGLIPSLPADPASVEKLTACAAPWYEQVSALYLQAYFDETRTESFVPSTPEHRELFLDAFLLQKALYEARYELNNRPTWLGIPLRGILSLIDA
jgi:maltose alpha-D-glucosyltransferase/alpha-amylase